MRYLAVVLSLGLVGCGSKVEPETLTDATPTGDTTSDTSIDAGPFVCADEKGQMPVALKTCTTDSECSQSVRQTDCCGSMLAVGVRADVVGVFGACERERQKELPLCDCIPKPLRAEDGAEIPADAAARVRCDMGMCTTFMR